MSDPGNYVAGLDPFLHVTSLIYNVFQTCSSENKNIHFSHSSVVLRVQIYFFFTEHVRYVILTEFRLLWHIKVLNFLRGGLRPGREADQSLPYCGVVKNDRVMPTLPNKSSWHGAQLHRTGTNLPFNFYLL
jgi:hypothetical protein